MALYEESNIVLKKQGNEMVSSTHVRQSQFYPVYYEHTIFDRYENFTKNTRYPIYAYLFQLSNVGVITNYDLLDFDSIILRMIRYSRSLWSDMYEETRYLPWMRKNYMFFEWAFFHEEIYIHWDPAEEEFTFYIKTSGDNSKMNSETKFINLEDNNTYTFPDPEMDLVCHKWGGRKENRFKPWFKLAYGMEASLMILQNLKFLFNKRIYVEAGLNFKADSNTLNNFKQDLCCLSTFIKNSDHKLSISTIEQSFVEAPDLLAFVNVIYDEFDREISEFGRVANLNPKPERKTAGENYIAMDKNIDDKRAIFDNLELMCLEFVERGWPYLEFKVNTEESLGIIVEESKTDQTPTSEDMGDSK